MKNGFRIVAVALFVTFLIVTPWAAHVGFKQGVSRVYREGGPMENMQAGLLALGCIGFLLSMVADQRRHKWVMGSCAFLCFSLLGREIEVEHFNLPFVLDYALGRGRSVVFVILLFLLLMVGAFHFKHHLRASFAFLQSRRGITLMVGGACLVAGHVVEEITHSRPFMFVEEAIELFGYACVFLASLPERLAR